MSTSRLSALVGTLLLTPWMHIGVIAQGGGSPRPPLVLAESGHFFVGGQYAKVKDGNITNGAMYVKSWIPATVTQPYPVVMIHGMGVTGTTFEGTPDGREGWAQYFVRAGYKVYVVDQPARGRSPYHPELNGELTRGGSTTETSARNNTATAVSKQWPQAHLHTQWPGAGVRNGQEGDPIFDHYYASVVESLPAAKSEPLMRVAGAALLDKIGPAILLGHSQGVALAWQVADARPQLIKAILAIDPCCAATAPTVADDGTLTGALSIATPLTYSPPISDFGQLVKRPQSELDRPGLVRCWTQGEPVRQLPNLKGIPTALVFAEASRAAQLAHCFSKYLTQAGVTNDFIRLEEVGIRGNGHQMMLEKNSDDIARFLVNWLRKNLKPAS